MRVRQSLISGSKLFKGGLIPLSQQGQQECPARQFVHPCPIIMAS